MKTCSKCGVEKEAEGFYKNSSAHDGLQTRCKPCKKEDRALRVKDPEKENARRRARYAESPGKVLETNARWARANPDKIAARARLYYETHKEELRAYRKEWSATNLDRRAELQRVRYQTDLQFKLQLTLRTRLNKALGFQAARRTSSAVRSLGCTVPELKARIEALFWPGMTWENRGVGPGTWQLDHIRPLASFDLTDSEQQLSACHFTNLQPLWWEDNLKKSDTWDGDMTPWILRDKLSSTGTSVPPYPSEFSAQHSCT